MFKTQHYLRKCCRVEPFLRVFVRQGRLPELVLEEPTSSGTSVAFCHPVSALHCAHWASSLSLYPVAGPHMVTISIRALPTFSTSGHLCEQNLGISYWVCFERSVLMGLFCCCCCCSRLETFGNFMHESSLLPASLVGFMPAWLTPRRLTAVPQVTLGSGVCVCV